MPSSKLLINESPLQVLPTLAKLLGLDRAVIIQQIHYWLEKSDNVRDGYRWIYNSYTAWSEQFTWLSSTAIGKHVRLLEKDGWLIPGRFNGKAFDRTKWYRLNYDKLNAAIDAESDNDSAKSSEHSTVLVPPIPETTPETTPEKSIGELPEWLDGEAWDAFLEMRKVKKKSPTPRAIVMLLKKLDSLRLEGNDPTAVLNKSTICGWTDVFEIKSNGKTPLSAAAPPIQPSMMRVEG